MPCSAPHFQWQMRVELACAWMETALVAARIWAVEVAPAKVAGGEHVTANQVARDAARDMRRFGILVANGKALSTNDVSGFLSQAAGYKLR